MVILGKLLGILHFQRSESGDKFTYLYYSIDLGGLFCGDVPIPIVPPPINKLKTSQQQGCLLDGQERFSIYCWVRLGTTPWISGGCA